MPLGGATKKIQKILDTAEELYNKVVQLREDVMEMRETVQGTNERVAALENKIDQQAAILEALAAEQDVDVEALVTEVAIDEAEPTDGGEPRGEAGGAATDGDGPSGGEDPDIPSADAGGDGSRG